MCYQLSRRFTYGFLTQLSDTSDPTDLGDYAYLSGLMQGEAIRALNELYRRNKPICMGALIWQLNDVWPVASWASIDYYGEWKAAHHFTRNSFAPVLVSPVVEKDKVLIHLVSDRREIVKGKLDVTLCDFAGKRTTILTRDTSVGQRLCGASQS